MKNASWISRSFGRRMRAVNVVIGLCMWLAVIGAHSGFGEERAEAGDGESALVFHDDFARGLRGWAQEGQTIRLATGADHGRTVRISRQHRRGATFIKREFSGYEGTLVFEAIIKGEHVAPWSEPYHGAKFQGVVSSPGEEPLYLSDDFQGDSDWTTRTFEVPDLKKDDTILLRIGLESAMGTMYVDEVKVWLVPQHQPDQ